MNPERAREGGSGRKDKSRSKRRELSRVTEELRGTNGTEHTDRVERVREAKRKRREIFLAKSELRAARERGEPGIGALPDFVVIGAPKCGTTFFYHLLTGHPLVEPAACKEPRYFDLLFDEGAEWYRGCFAAPRWKDGRRTITGEATPSYLYQHRVPERMAGLVPRARLIALLRNPVDRTYSAYHHQVKRGKESRTFERYVEACFDDPRGVHLSHGVYVDHLRRWSAFFDDGQMLVLKSEDFFERPHERMRSVLKFLGLPDWAPETSGAHHKHNKGGYERKMHPVVGRRLEEYFEPHNRRLYEYLGVDFGW